MAYFTFDRKCNGSYTRDISNGSYTRDIVCINIFLFQHNWIGKGLFRATRDVNESLNNPEGRIHRALQTSALKLAE